MTTVLKYVYGSVYVHIRAVKHIRSLKSSVNLHSLLNNRCIAYATFGFSPHNERYFLKETGQRGQLRDSKRDKKLVWAYTGSETVTKCRNYENNV